MSMKVQLQLPLLFRKEVLRTPNCFKALSPQLVPNKSAYRPQLCRFRSRLGNSKTLNLRSDYLSTNRPLFGRWRMPISHSCKGSAGRPLEWSGQRRLVTTGLLASVAALAFESLALADELGRNIPSFASDRYRLVLLRPQRDLPAVRLFRLSG